MSLLIHHYYQFGEYTLDTDQRVVLCAGQPLPLTPKLFEILLILVQNGGRIVEKEELMNRLWPDIHVEEANLTTNIQQLRKALGDNARNPVYIATVPRRGYRFIAPITTEEVTTIKGTDRTRKVGERPSWQRWPVILGIAIVLFATSAGWYLWSHLSALPQPAGGKFILAVLPLKNLTGDEAQEYFSDGLTEEMITQLGNLDPERCGVIACTSVMRYKNSQESLNQIGRDLGVQYILEGSVRRESDRVRITAQLIQIKDQTHLWSREYDRELNHLLSLQADIAREVASEIRLTINNQGQSNPGPSVASSPKTYEAYDLYLRGQYLWNKRTPESLRQSIDYFQQAVAEDPNYARAYAGLADSYALIGGYSARPQAEFMQKARSAALRALEIDERLPEAHTSLALIVQNYDLDWQAAEKEFRRALELNANDATAHHWYAEHLMWEGRFVESLRESEQARRLDPLSLIIAADNAAILYYSRKYDQAIEETRKIRQIEANFPRANIIVAACVERGLVAEALSELEKQTSEKTAPWYTAALAYIYGRSGEQIKAERALKRLLQYNQREPVDAGLFVWAYLGMSKKERALEWLEKAYSEHSNCVIGMKVDPLFDPLRGDARFQDLLRRIGLA